MGRILKVNIVVGLLFGDEGKGITTDYLCRRHSDIVKHGKIVVRYSGGQQAGHNVRIGDVTHVHSNFGSGTLAGVPSYFSEHTVVYPLTMYREYLSLKSKGADPVVYLHPLTNITTPYDVAFNRLREKQVRHGSCGLGVGSTMTRNIDSGYKLFAVDLTYIDALKEKLRNIQNYYYDKVPLSSRSEFTAIVDEEMPFFDNAIDKLKFEIKDYDFLMDFNEITFEGSQGILLDMDHGFFPNVTYANTTTKNAFEICDKLMIPPFSVNVYYVTRCYQTRHGNGWMSNRDEIKLINTEDEINKYNEWQSNFKIGEIDYDLINYSLAIDSIYSMGANKNIVVTCLDQRPGFKMDYSKIKIDYANVYESYSSDSKDFKNTHLLV